MHETVQERNIRTGFDTDPYIGPFCEISAPRVYNNKLGTSINRLMKPQSDGWMTGIGVTADHENHISLANIGNGVCHRAATE